MTNIAEAVREIKSLARAAAYEANSAAFEIERMAGRARITQVTASEDKPERIKRILLPMLRHEYGRQEWGDSLEYQAFYQSMKEIKDVEFFDFLEYKRTHGKGAVEEKLLQLARKGDYDLFMFALMMDDFEYGKIRKISSETPTITVNWFSDDQWRFGSFSYKWAGAFNFCTTTCKEAVEKYSKLGYSHAIRTQWAAHPPMCKPSEDAKDICTSVCFVGQKHGSRGKLVSDLRKLGIAVEAFGAGWKSGRVGRQRMVDLFAGSKITLNPAESSFYFAPKQMKARVFEVPMCGGFQIAGELPEISDYYEDKKEIAHYRTTHELADKIRYYLDNEKERERIRQAGEKRTHLEHTYAKRFARIFDEVESKTAEEKRA